MYDTDVVHKALARLRAARYLAGAMKNTVAAFTAATTFQSALALAEQLVQERENNDYPISFESEEQELAFYRNAARLAGLNVGSSLMLCAAAPW